MTAASITKVLRDALAVSQMTPWELGRRANVKNQVIEAALQDVSRVSVEAVLRIADALDLDLALAQAQRKRQVGDVLSVIDLVTQRLEPDSLVYVPALPWVLALELEGTLIGETADVLARPGLYRFLTCCRGLVPRLVVFSAVEESRFREIALLLASEGSAPPWFVAVEHVQRLGSMSDLMPIPQADPRFTLLVAGTQQAGTMEWQSQGIAISKYEGPVDSTDRELDRVLEEIAQRTTAPTM